jgi:cytochrome P450
MSAVVHTAPSQPEPVSMAYLPDESFVWGNARVMSWNNLEMFHLCEKMAGIVRTRCFFLPVYVVNDPAAIADVLVNSPQSFHKPYVLRRLRLLFGNGLLTSDGATWKHNRHLVQPAFSNELLPRFVQIVQKNTLEMIASWRPGEKRDVYHDLVEVCMKNVMQALFGVFDEELAQVTRELAATSHELVGAVFSWSWLLPFLWPGPLKSKLKKQLRELDSCLDRLIAERTKEPPRNDFLGILLGGGGHHAPLSRQAIRDEVVTILLAGHETTASALVWCLYLLSEHPEHADVLAAELGSRLQGESPSLRHLDHLPMLHATLDETLRLYPPTHRFARTVNTPVKVGGHLLPKGAEVVIPIWSVHRSSRWYEMPLQFRPERWTPEFRRSLPRFAFLPFSGGPRICVGSNLAWSEAAVILGVLAQRYRFSRTKSEPLEPAAGLTLVPGGGRFHVRIEHREQTDS